MKFEISTINIALELFGILICLTVILCRNFLVGVYLRKLRTNFTLLVFCEALLLFVSAMTEILMSIGTRQASALLPAFYFQRYLFHYLLLGLFTDYTAKVFLPENGRPLRLFTMALVGVSIGFLAANLVYPFYYTIGEGGELCRGSFYILSQLPGILIFFVNLAVILLGRRNVEKYVFVSFLFYIILPVAALFMQIFFVRLDLANISFIIVLMNMFVVMQNQLIQSYVAQKRELQESKTRMMLSQIKPHFIFNTLTSIAQLCDDDPPQAKSTTIAFADYLRGSLAALDQVDTVPFRAELKHIENYLQVECTRFGELLSVEYDIETTDFRVPVLSIQPLVENAVKHGVGMKEDGGTVRLSVRKDAEHIVLSVSDDGVGFDPAGLESDETRRGIGIRSSRERLKELSHAHMQIESAPGKGTTIKILFPPEACGEEGEKK